MYFENIRPEDIFRQRGNQKGLLVDLRSPKEYAEKHIPGAVNIPYDELQKNIPRLKQMVQQSSRRGESFFIIVYCDRGNTSLRAARDLYNRGFFVKNVYGGISAYQGPVVKTVTIR